MKIPSKPTLAMRLTDNRNPQSLGFRFRARRIGPLLKLIESAYNMHGHVRLLDVGGRKLYWNIVPQDFLRNNKVSITILNLPGELQGSDDEIFKHVAGDACNLPEYADKEFHIVHSNSVIEHVGNWENVKRFASEVRRVGSALFVQTPYFWFPIEPHLAAPFFHWIPRPLQETLVLRFQLGHSGRARDLDAAIIRIQEGARMLDLRAYKLLFPDCTILKERFCLLTKSLIAVRPQGG